jgi:hypothetical protein
MPTADANRYPVFIGGPCGGQVWKPDRPAPAGSVIMCGGARYVMSPEGDLWFGGPPREPGEDFGIPGVRRAERAWANLQRALGPDTARTLRKISRANARIRRAGG